MLVLVLAIPQLAWLSELRLVAQESLAVGRGVFVGITGGVFVGLGTGVAGGVGVRKPST